MISESECENPNNDFLQEDQLDYDFIPHICPFFTQPKFETQKFYT